MFTLLGTMFKLADRVPPGHGTWNQVFKQAFTTNNSKRVQRQPQCLDRSGVANVEKLEVSVQLIESVLVVAYVPGLPHKFRLKARFWVESTAGEMMVF